MKRNLKKRLMMFSCGFLLTTNPFIVIDPSQLCKAFLVKRHCSGLVDVGFTKGCIEGTHEPPFEL